VTGIEPVTPCLQRLCGRKINNLRQIRRIAMNRYNLLSFLGLISLGSQLVVLGQVR
jgi:hypothetical protein